MAKSLGTSYAVALSSAPGVGSAGNLYYNTATSLLNTSNGSAWAAVPSDALVVHLAGTETITGAKTFSTAPIVDTIAATAAGATPTLWATVTTGSIAVGAGLTTGALNIATVGTGVTPIAVGHTNATLAVVSSGFNLTTGGALTLTSTIAASGLAGSLLSSANPVALGTVGPGTSAIPSRQDHVHPTTGLMSNPLTTNGDIIYAVSTTPTRLAIGTAGQALVTNTGATAPAWTTLTLENLPDAWAKRSVKAATTANIATLAGGAPNTLDGVSLALNDRILVKDQSSAQQNGIYIVTTLGTGANGTWARSLDADTASEISGALVNVDQGTVNGGLAFDNDFKTTDTLGTTVMPWYRVVDLGYSMLIGTTAVQIGRASGALTLAGINLTQPTIGDFTNATHTHAAAASGGTLSAYATDSLVVHLAGTETITGAKTFSSAIIVPDGGEGSLSIRGASSSEAGMWFDGTGGLGLATSGGTVTRLTMADSVMQMYLGTILSMDMGYNFSNISHLKAVNQYTSITPLIVQPAASTSVDFFNVKDTAGSTVRLGVDSAGVPYFAASTTSLPSLRIPHGTAPSSPTNGDVWTTTAGMYVRINGATVGPLGSGGGGMANPMTTLGDVIYGGASGTPTRLAGDTSNTNRFLRSVSSGGVAAAPSWQAIAVADVTGAATDSLVVHLAGTETITGAKTFSATSLAITNASSTAPALVITNTNTDAFGASLNIRKQPSDNAMSNLDEIGTIYFQGIGTGGSLVNGAQIQSYATGSNTASYVPSNLVFKIMSSGGTPNTALTINSDSSVQIYGPLLAPAATTSIPSIRLPHGTAPSSPTNGDLWTTTAGAFMRINGLTVPIAGHIQSDTAPTPAYNGLLWTDTVSGGTFEYYDSFWVEVGSAGGQLIAPVTITGTVAASVPLTVKGAASQSSNFFEIKDSSNTVLLSLDSTGGLNVPTGPIKPRAGTTGEPPMQFTSGTNLTTAVGGGVEYDGKTVYITPDTAAVGGRAINDMSIMVMSVADLALSNATGVQSLFAAANDTLTNVAGSTAYEFECVFHISTTGATSNTLNFAIGGTATLTGIYYHFHVDQNATGSGTPTNTATYGGYLATAASTALTAAVATATYRTVTIKGMIRVNAAGTLIPQVAYSAAPGAAPSVKAGAMFRLRPLGSNAAAIVVGAWA